MGKSNSKIAEKKSSSLPKETREEYFARLDQSIKELEEGKVVSFTGEQYEKMTAFVLKYKPSKTQLREFLESIGVDTTYAGLNEQD